MRRINIVLLAIALCLIPNAAEAKPLKSCGSVGTKGFRVLQNVVCKDGSPNSRAVKLLKQNTPQMMKLKKNSTFHQIYVAICKDWYNSTGPDLMVTYDYLVALYDWNDSQYQAVYSNYPDCDKY